ncbi:MAG: PTS sugar transporter subunit IIA [Kiritimatiellia bacterium]
MSLREILAEGVITLSLRATSKAGVIEELIDLMLAQGIVQDREDALKAILERERRMSTGMQHGVALPHGRSEKITRMAVALGLKKEGVEFGSLDGEPVRIVVLSIAPASQATLQLRFLSEIGKLLNTESIRGKLLGAKTDAEVFDVLTDCSHQNVERR